MFKGKKSVATITANLAAMSMELTAHYTNQVELSADLADQLAVANEEARKSLAIAQNLESLLDV